MLIGVLGAGMSTANGGILALSSVISRNLIQREIQGKLLKRAHMGNRALLITTRFLLVPVMIGSLILAYYKPQPGTLLSLAFDVVLAGCMAPLLLGLYWHKANTPAAIASIAIGSACRIVVFVVVALATQKEAPGYLRHGVVDYVPPEEDVVLGHDLKGYTPPAGPPPKVKRKHFIGKPVVGA